MDVIFFFLIINQELVVSCLIKRRLIAVDLSQRHPFPMNNLTSLKDIALAIRNLIRTGSVTDIDLDEGGPRPDRRNANHLAELTYLSLAGVVGFLGL